MSKVGRNDPCPCGSGKKYKKCCLVETFVEVGKKESIEKRLIENIIQFIGEHNKKLSLDGHKVLTMMKNSIISLYEVQEVMPGKGILLKDLLLGGNMTCGRKWQPKA